MKSFIQSTLVSFLAISILSAAVWAIEPIADVLEQAEALDAENGYLYAGGSRAITILSLANPGNPETVAQLTDGVKDCRDIVVSGNRLYVVMVGQSTSSNPARLNFWSIDVSDPTKPQVVTKLHVGEEPQGVYAADGLVYIAADREGVFIVDPNENSLVGTIDTGVAAFDVYVRGNRAYVGGDLRLSLVDISDKAGPKVLDEMPFDGWGVDLAAEGNLLAVAQEWSGVGIYDISDPDSLNLVENYIYYGINDQKYVWGIDIRNLYIYTGLLPVSSWDVTSPPDPGGLSILDILEIEKRGVREVGEKRMDHAMVDVEAYDGYVYGAEGDLGISVYRHGGAMRVTPTPTRPTPTPTFTYTATPTPTVPTLATPTPTRRAPTPTPTNTPTRVPPTPTPTPVPPTATPTRVPPTATPTRVPPTATPTTGPLTPTPQPPTATPTLTPSGGQGAYVQFASGFDADFVQEEGWNPTLPFSGDFQLGLYTIGTIPTDNAYAGATDGRGLRILLQPGQAVTLMSTTAVQTNNLPAMLRMNVRADSDGAQVALAAVDAAVTGSVASLIPANSASFVNRYRRIQFLYNADSNDILPIFQIVHVSGGPVNVYIDNFEVHLIPPGSMIPAGFLGADGTTP